MQVDFTIIFFQHTCFQFLLLSFTFTYERFHGGKLIFSIIPLSVNISNGTFRHQPRGYDCDIETHLVCISSGSVTHWEQLYSFCHNYPESGSHVEKSLLISLFKISSLHKNEKMLTFSSYLNPNQYIYFFFLKILIFTE